MEWAGIFNMLVNTAEETDVHFHMYQHQSDEMKLEIFYQKSDQNQRTKKKYKNVKFLLLIASFLLILSNPKYYYHSILEQRLNKTIIIINIITNLEQRNKTNNYSKVDIN